MFLVKIGHRGPSSTSVCIYIYIYIYIYISTYKLIEIRIFQKSYGYTLQNVPSHKIRKNHAVHNLLPSRDKPLYKYVYEL